MITRRGILFSALAAPLLSSPAWGLPESPDIEVLPEATLLSEESASGFRLLTGSGNSKLNANRPRVIVLPGVSNLPPLRIEYLRGQADLGSWIVLEFGLCFSSSRKAAEQEGLLSRHLNVQMDRACSPVRQMYVSYEWPQRHLIRSFGSGTALRCSERAVIANSGGVPVCSSQRLGRGGVVFLGSMLGPSLFAEDREAHQLCRSLLYKLQVRCARRLSGDTSTRA